MRSRLKELSLGGSAALGAVAVVIVAWKHPLPQQEGIALLPPAVAGETSPVPAFLRGLETGSTAPAFSGTDVRTGETVRVGAGPGRTLLRFWSPECRFCVAELDRVKAAIGRLPATVRVVTVANAAPLEATRRFVATHRILFPVIWDEHGTLTDLYRVKAVPYAFVIEDGVIVEQLIGPYSAIAPALDKALGGCEETLHVCTGA